MAVLKFLNDINHFDVTDNITNASSTPRVEGVFPPFPLDHFKAPTGVSDMWFALYFGYYQPPNQSFMRVTDQAGNEIINFGASAAIGSGGTLGFTVQGGTVNSEGIVNGMESSGMKRLDMHIDVAGGTVDVYIEAVLVASWTGTFTGVTSIGGFSWKAMNSATTGWGLEVGWAFIADEDTRPILMYDSYPTANGAVQQWAGDEALIDGAAQDDGNVIISTTAEQTSVFVTGDLATTFAAGYEIMGLAISARGRVVGAGGPSSIAVAARSGTTIGNGPTTALSPGFKNYQSVISIDPNTGSAWTYASINAAQIGVTSKA
jgi:hypothetical protein